jgi:putative DNA primase/helicase
MTTTTLSNNMIVTDQPNNPAGVQAAMAEPQRFRSMQDWIDNYPGKPWRDAAGRLAQWTIDRLVNRDDAYRAYKSFDRRRYGELITYTAPWFEDARVYGSLDHDVIERHFRGEDLAHLIGLHAISVENTSRWFAIDVDQHGEDGPVLGEENIDAAFTWYGELQALGFRPLFLNASGECGFVLLVCLSEAIPSQVVHGFVSDFVQDFQTYGLKKAPDVYPGEAVVNPHRPYGSWWRLPGRHHTSQHWTKVWGGDRWLEGSEAIEVIVATTGDSPELIPGFADR